MSRWKFGEFETEVDFTDADFLDRLEAAQEQLDRDSKQVSLVGKTSDIIREQVGCFSRFFDAIFGEGTSELMYGGKTSLELAVRSCDEFSRFGESEETRMDSAYAKYKVNKPVNRQQRRYQDRKRR